MSGASSNLTAKMNTPAHKSVTEFVQAQTPGTKFSFDGPRGSQRSRLCRHPDDPSKQTDCVDIAMEARSLFETMQKLNFFCQLPQDPSKTHITCERIPQ
ncbi:uncharacterized protein FA14DRAFT_161906 [Meira miltonrushii]|uniref:Uncharacterized protein n=1 Tax=Meira miltonrushii TaxID=1280837 RepID=A0A316VAF4_9BASI|nr:uncharacterized protein FA14DRAFT_161906 [Meira miltonrushii]PWN32495.1 hypothetical protein FA14DRAFT_161906 [Meira miltonrushii]